MSQIKMKALIFSSFGSPDVLEYKEVPIPELKEDEVLVKMKAIGVNYADIYRRRGNYHLDGKPPYINGYEGCGIVVRSNSSEYNVGDTVGFADVPFAYAEYTAVPETSVIPIEKNLDMTLVASVLLQGLTAQYLSSDSHQVRTGEIILIHAASGGVGQLLTQICKMNGTEVIGLTRSRKKTQIITDNGADHVLILDENWKSKVMKITQNRGVDVVYDSIGSTLVDSFEITRERGQVILYGLTGGNPALFDPRDLMETSKTLTGGDLWSYLTSAEERKRRANELFQWVKDGAIQVKEPVIFKLSEGQEAHRFLEEGKSTGKVLLIPDKGISETSR